MEEKIDLSIIKEISKLSLKRGDILIVKISTKMSPEDFGRIRDNMKYLLRRAGLDNKVPVMIIDSDDIEFQIISGEGVK